MVVGKLLSFEEGLFSGAMLVLASLIAGLLMISPSNLLQDRVCFPKINHGNGESSKTSPLLYSVSRGNTGDGRNPTTHWDTWNLANRGLDTKHLSTHQQYIASMVSEGQKEAKYVNFTTHSQHSETSVTKLSNWGVTVPWKSPRMINWTTKCPLARLDGKHMKNHPASIRHPLLFQRLPKRKMILKRDSRCFERKVACYNLSNITR